MEEIWKDIPGYEGLYQVSTFGRVKVLEQYRPSNPYEGVICYYKEKIIKPCKRRGYLYVSLTKDHFKITPNIHRLVAQVFIPNPNNYPCINHKDENKYNNQFDNLEWCDWEYNNNYGHYKEKIKKSKLQPIRKKVKCIETGEVFKNIAEAAKNTKSQPGLIAKCCKGKQKTTNHFSWQYI